MKKILSVIFVILGTSSLIYCILNNVDGIGRAALILAGVIFISLGTFKNIKS